MNPSIGKERATLVSETVWNASAAKLIVVYPESTINSRRKLALAYKRIPVGGGDRTTKSVEGSQVIDSAKQQKGEKLQKH
jgi:hypothetical protein